MHGFTCLKSGLFSCRSMVCDVANFGGLTHSNPPFWTAKERGDDQVYCSNGTAASSFLESAASKQWEEPIRATTGHVFLLRLGVLLHSHGATPNTLVYFMGKSESKMEDG